ncbi:hypothetical protein Poly51_10650 [Rubripirellula tenax]|uniref:Uncharacterized protein n=1 Tax=Rubripirellula tenax TaxID=2528015 RepID=A0A5C6FLT3_9BACT|nr:hypothetical protein [Rubripirellula tenax]TWU60784.1 hypothetical protein Poly51_10650 [Rubripirellula tenax]
MLTVPLPQRLKVSAIAFFATVTLGLLVWWSVASYKRSVEVARAKEAYSFLCDVRAAQYDHFERHGKFAESIDPLDLPRPIPTHFSCGKIEIEAGCGWSLKLARVGATLGCSEYELVFNERGFDEVRSRIDDQINPHQSATPLHVVRYRADDRREQTTDQR